MKPFDPRADALPPPAEQTAVQSATPRRFASIFKAASGVPCQWELWNRWHAEHNHASHEKHAADARDAFLYEIRQGISTKSLRILDIGCGQGRDAIEFALRGHRVDALDHSPVALERAREAARRKAESSQHAELNITWIEADYGDGLPFKDRTFDGVYSHLSLHYLNKRHTKQLFNDIRRVLRPNGMLLFTVRTVMDPLYEDGERLSKSVYLHNGHVRHFFDRSYTKRLLSSWHGVEVDSYDTHHWTPNPGVFIRVQAWRPED